MANLIGIVGSSGSGKSTSLGENKEIGIEGLNPKETVIINVAGKPLPIRGFKTMYNTDKKISEGGNYIETSDSETICNVLYYVDKERPDIKNVVIEDYQYLMGFMVMDKARDKGFEKWSLVGAAGFKPINVARTLRPDLNIIITFHQEKAEDGSSKIKTAGKLIDNVITLEGLFTVILFTNVEKELQSKQMKYTFMTNTDGTNTAKSPAGMFNELYIPNDIGYVIKQINKYNNG